MAAWQILLLAAVCILGLAGVAFAAIRLGRRSRAGTSEAGAIPGSTRSGFIRPGGPAGLQGNLGHTPLHDLLQFLSLGRRTGLLEVASGRRTGGIVLRDGLIQKTFYRGKEGLEAIFLMLDLDAGDFEFYDQRPEDVEGGLGIEVIDAIMLWMGKAGNRNQRAGSRE